MNNTQAEKLQKLIDVAQANGYEKRYGALHETETCIYNDKITCIQFPVSLETYIFDHEFIKALCKASSKERWSYDAPQGELYDPWEHHVTQLALSENRIDYLYEVFCE